MKTVRASGVLLLGALSVSLARSDDPRPATARQTLQVFNDLIGSWRGTGTPAGSREEQQKGFWSETITWQWQFQDKDVWLKADFARGKVFRTGELRYLPQKAVFEFTVKTPANEVQTFSGKTDKRVLTLERKTPAGTERLVLTLLHANRFLYRLDVKPASKSVFSRRFQVGATKEGVAFAEGDGRPECVVSGGLGSIAVSYQGETYYVCCSGCRTEFNENPEKYIKEYHAKKKKTGK